MTKDSIKISQEINFNGLATWVSIGATLLPEDNVIESLKSLQKDITEYQQSEAKAFKESKKKEPAPINNEIQATVDAINESRSLEELKTFWAISKSNLILSTQYKAKEKLLNDAK